MRLINLLSILTVCVSFAFSSLAQENYAVAQSAKELQKANEKGVYSFQIPADITKEDVALSAEFYTVYFSVDYNPETSEVVIRLTELSNKNRQVITRFFISLGLREIRVDDRIYAVQPFYEKFIKQVKTVK